jgi:integrase/recombinase XerD
MSELVTLGPWLRRFLVEHIVTERNLARNTRTSYRDTFSLLLPFVSRNLRKPVDRLAVRDLTSVLVLQFLAHIEEDRGCSARTRNQRLAAIRAFARFIGSRDPAHVEWCGHIRAIASKKSTPTSVGWLTRAEMEAMLAVPDRKTRRGRSEYALLLFLYNTGARVSEATHLKVRDLQIGRGNGGHDLATLHGKGGKTRQCPLWPETERVLADESTGRAGEDAVFISRLGTPFTRFGVYRLIERCAARVPELAGRMITPHVIRHTTACHLVLAGVDINTIRAWLGHVSISTTNIYAEIDLTLKANAVALCEVGQPRPARSWKADKDLMAFLKSLSGVILRRPPSSTLALSGAGRGATIALLKAGAALSGMTSLDRSGRPRHAICHPVLAAPRRMNRTPSCGASWMRNVARSAPRPNACRSSLKSLIRGDRASASMPAASARSVNAASAASPAASVSRAM